MDADGLLLLKNPFVFEIPVNPLELPLKELNCSHPENYTGSCKVLCVPKIVYVRNTAE